MSLIDTDIKTAGGPFGPVLQGVLTLKARITPVTFIRNEDPNIPRGRIHESATHRLAVAQSGGAVEMWASAMMLDDGRCINRGPGEQPFSHDTLDAYFLELMSETNRVYPGRIKRLGLLLQRAPSGSPAQYIRIAGDMQLFDGEGDQQNPAPSLRRFEHAVECLESHGDGVYTFTMC